LSANWGIYLWSVSVDRVVEAALGYYITPLVAVTFGVLVLKEKLRKLQIISVCLATIGVIILTVGYGSLPWIALVLAVTWGMYGLLKKTLNAGALETLSIETLFTLTPNFIYLMLIESQGRAAFGHGWATTLLLIFGGGATIAPVFGYGMCEHRSCLPRPMNPVGLSMEWIRIPAGCRIGRHRLSVKQVLIVYQGSLCLHLSDVEETEQYRLNGESDAWDTFSVPEYVWRELCADQAQDVIILSMLATDDRKMIDWDASILARAKIQGLMRDADGYIAPKRLVERA
ncbi:MAG: hypothetical protein EBW47_00260, partial [Betaproteobacteria bacterium]|nr:hypothetical protein [Betaproteobacteria bacterium]